jgi:hypothetical protein
MHNNSKLIFLALAIIPTILSLVPNVYAGGPRFDAGDDLTNDQADCYVNGYDAGTANLFNKDRDQECKDLGRDQYVDGWLIGCRYSAIGDHDREKCKDMMNDAESTDRVSLGDENMQNCYDDGYEDGQNNPFDHDKNGECIEYQNMYHQGFIQCVPTMSIQE